MPIRKKTPPTPELKNYSLEVHELAKHLKTQPSCIRMGQKTNVREANFEIDAAATGVNNKRAGNSLTPILAFMQCRKWVKWKGILFARSAASSYIHAWLFTGCAGNETGAQRNFSAWLNVPRCCCCQISGLYNPSIEALISFELPWSWQPPSEIVHETTC